MPRGQKRTSALSPGQGQLAFPSTKRAKTPDTDDKGLSSPKKGLSSPKKTGDTAIRVPLSPRNGNGNLRIPHLSDGTKARRALASTQPVNLQCRDAEMECVTKFVGEHVASETAGSLYISGQPGTGKTALVTHVLENAELNYKWVYLNAMGVQSSKGIFERIAVELLTKFPKNTHLINYKKNTRYALASFFKSFGPIPMIVLVVDEIDQLASYAQEVLYTMFEWPAMTNSRLILIGIANSLDFVERTLPRLLLRSSVRPMCINVKPYTLQQIRTILSERLKEAQVSAVVDEHALSFVAGRVSSESGDIRMALDILRRAIDIVKVTCPPRRIFTDDDNNEPRREKVDTVTLATVVRVCSKLAVQQSAQVAQTLPLHQQLLVCTVLLLTRNRKVKAFRLGKVYDIYSKLCMKRAITKLDQSYFIQMCALVKDRGILNVKSGKGPKELSLVKDESDVEYAFKDNPLVASILADGLPK